MRITVIKFIVIVGILFAATLFSVAINGGNSNSKAPLFVVVGVVAAIGAVSKYKPESSKDSSADKQELDKNS